MRKLEELAKDMSAAVCKSTGAHVHVELKQLPAAALETGFDLQFDRDTFISKAICT